MHDVCLHFVRRLGITELKKNYIYLIQLFDFEIYIILFLFKSSILMCNNIGESHSNKK